MIELELTFLAKRLPQEIKSVKPERLIDIYIPERSLHPRLRLRQMGTSYEVTKKTPLDDGDASAQTEHTIKLDKDEFEALASCSSRKVVKDRYRILLEGSQAELDVFQDKLHGLVLIDFEFASEADKATFTPTAACLVDVTQETFIAGGKLAGKTYKDIEGLLDSFGYQKLNLKKS